MYINRLLTTIFLISVPNDPRRVIVTELALVVQDRDDVTLDLTGNNTVP